MNQLYSLEVSTIYSSVPKLTIIFVIIFTVTLADLFSIWLIILYMVLWASQLKINYFKWLWKNAKRIRKCYWLKLEKLENRFKRKTNFVILMKWNPELYLKERKKYQEPQTSHTCKSRSFFHFNCQIQLDFIQFIYHVKHSLYSYLSLCPKNFFFAIKSEHKSAILASSQHSLFKCSKAF